MSEDEFRGFTDPTNGTARVLLAHFLMLNYVLEMHFLGPSTKPFAFSKQISRAWVLNVGASLPDRYQKHMMWPIGMANGVMSM